MKWRRNFGNRGRLVERNSLTYEVIGAAMEVHRCLGPWHPERAYPRRGRSQ